MMHYINTHRINMQDIYKYIHTHTYTHTHTHTHSSLYRTPGAISSIYEAMSWWCKQICIMPEMRLCPLLRLHWVAICCSVMQFIAVCCSVAVRIYQAFLCDANKSALCKQWDHVLCSGVVCCVSCSLLQFVAVCFIEHLPGDLLGDANTSASY